MSCSKFRSTIPKYLGIVFYRILSVVCIDSQNASLVITMDGSDYTLLAESYKSANLVTTERVADREKINRKFQSALRCDRCTDLLSGEALCAGWHVNQSSWQPMRRRAFNITLQNEQVSNSALKPCLSTAVWQNSRYWYCFSRWDILRHLNLNPRIFLSIKEVVKNVKKVIAYVTILYLPLKNMLSQRKSRNCSARLFRFFLSNPEATLKKWKIL